jgi:hypothetical protein
MSPIGKARPAVLTPDQAYFVAIALVDDCHAQGYLDAAQAATLKVHIRARYEQGVENALRSEVADFVRDEMTRLFEGAGLPLNRRPTNYLGLREPTPRSRPRSWRA